MHEAPALAVTTRAMRGNIQAEKDVQGQEKYSSEGPHLSKLERVARTAKGATKALERENEIVHERERSNVVHDLDGIDVGE